MSKEVNQKFNLQPQKFEKKQEELEITKSADKQISHANKIIVINSCEDIEQ